MKSTSHSTLDIHGIPQSILTFAHHADLHVNDEQYFFVPFAHSCHCNCLLIIADGTANSLYSTCFLWLSSDFNSSIMFSTIFLF